MFPQGVRRFGMRQAILRKFSVVYFAATFHLTELRIAVNAPTRVSDRFLEQFLAISVRANALLKAALRAEIAGKFSSCARPLYKRRAARPNSVRFESEGKRYKTTQTPNALKTSTPTQPDPSTHH